MRQSVLAKAPKVSEFIEIDFILITQLSCNYRKSDLLLQLSCINFDSMGVIRKTKSVEMLLAEFDKSDGAISTVTLVERLSAFINKTTVYRVLDRLEDEGVLHSFLGKEGVKWFAKCAGCTKDKHQDVHPHFECLNCGTVDCLSVDVSIPVIPKREVSKWQVLLQGTCEACLS